MQGIGKEAVMGEKGESTIVLKAEYESLTEDNKQKFLEIVSKKTTGLLQKNSFGRILRLFAII